MASYMQERLWLAINHKLVVHLYDVEMPAKPSMVIPHNHPVFEVIGADELTVG